MLSPVSVMVFFKKVFKKIITKISGSMRLSRLSDITQSEVMTCVYKPIYLQIHSCEIIAQTADLWSIFVKMRDLQLDKPARLSDRIH